MFMSVFIFSKAGELVRLAFYYSISMSIFENIIKNGAFAPKEQMLHLP